MIGGDGADGRLLDRLNTWPVIVALLIVFTGWAARLLVLRGTPMGGVEGRVLLEDTGRPMAGVVVTAQLTASGPKADQPDTEQPQWTDNREFWRSVSRGKTGHFRLLGIPEGDYEIDASTPEHNVELAKVHVSEGRLTPVTLELQRTQPSFSVVSHQQVFGTSEPPHVSVTGYVRPSSGTAPDTFNLSIYRTRLSDVLRDKAAATSLEEVGRDWDPAPKLPNDLLQPGARRAPLLQLSQSVPIRAADKEGFFYQRVSLGSRRPGLYLLDFRHGNDTGCTWLLVTNTALILKRAGSQLVAFAADMETGRPIARARVESYRGGASVASGVTDSRGLVELTVPTVSPERSDSPPALVTLVQRGNDESVVHRDDEQVEDNGLYAIYTYTDRPLYRPGQQIDFKGIVRRIVRRPARSGLTPLTAPDESPGRSYTVPAGAAVKVEIHDPLGEPLLRRTFYLNANGDFWGTARILSEDVSGVYTMTMEIDGETHTKDIVVASYRKPEVQITVSPDRQRYVRGEPVTVKVHAATYYGAPEAGAPVEYTVYGTPDWEADYPDDYDPDPENDAPRFAAYVNADQGYGQQVTDSTAKLDGNGDLVLHLTAGSHDSSSADQAMIYTCSVTLTTSTGQYVEGDGAYRVSPGDFRLTVDPQGYVAAPGQPAQVVVRAQDYDGNPVVGAAVTLNAVFEEWRGDAYVQKPAGELAGVTGATGATVFNYTPPSAGDLLLTGRARDSSGRKIIGRADLWVASDSGDLATTYNDLALFPDRRHYQPGQTARVLINASRVGETVLLTIEGSQVYHAQTITIVHHSTIVQVPILAGYGPDIYLAACYVRSKHFCQSSTPLSVPIPSASLKVTVTPNLRPDSPDSLPAYHPGQRIIYRVRTTDSAGRPAPAIFSLGVVDESIYALQDEDPTALRRAFYAAREDNVDTLYSFAAEYLGDADKAEPKIVARSKFPDTAYWNPELKTDAQGEATVSFTLPDNLTTWRATVNAASLDTRVGYAIDKVMATKPFLVQLELPRTLTQRDNSQVDVVAHNGTAKQLSASIRLTAAGAQIESAAVQRISLPPGGTDTLRWPVVARTPGAARVTVAGWTTGTVPRYTDAMELRLPVLAYGRLKVTTFAGEVTGAQPQTELVRLDTNAVPAESTLTIRVTPSLVGALSGGLDYLVGYPYGCVEQTMSRMLPDILAQRTLALGQRPLIRNAVELTEMVLESLARLYHFQHPDGGWGWWRHDSDDPWMTAYALYGLSVARGAGYPVSERALEKGRRALDRMVGTKQPDPFGLYCLAAAGDPSGARARLARASWAKLSPEDLAYLALAEHLCGRPAGASLQKLAGRAMVEGQMVYWPGEGSYTADQVTATAAALQALLVLQPKSDLVQPAFRWLLARRTGGYWENTRDTAWVLAALVEYLNRNPQRATGSVEILLNGRIVAEPQLSAANMAEQELVYRIPGQRLLPGKNTITFSRLGGYGEVPYSVELKQTVGSQSLPPVSVGGLQIQRQYFRLAARPDSNGQLAETATNNEFSVADSVRIRLTITTSRDMNYVLIEDPYPAGCEVSERGDADDVTDWSDWWCSTDVRDDRIAFFARSLPKGKHVIEYNLRAQTPGAYFALPALAQPMYDPEVMAESAVDQVVVR